MPSKDGGAEGSRTPDLRNAIAALSQLSYGPEAPSLSRTVSLERREGYERLWTPARENVRASAGGV